MLENCCKYIEEFSQIHFERADGGYTLQNLIFRGDIAQFLGEEAAGDDALSLSSKINKVFSKLSRKFRN